MPPIRAVTRVKSRSVWLTGPVRARFVASTLCCINFARYVTSTLLVVLHQLCFTGLRARLECKLA